MTHIETQVLIDAPIGEVWRILTGFAEMPRWNPFITAISGSLAPDERLTVTIAPAGGREMTFKPVILVATPGRELRWLGVFGSRWLFAGEHYFLLDEVDPQHTLVTHSERFSGILTPLVLRGAMLNATKKGFAAMNEALKRKAEDIVSFSGN